MNIFILSESVQLKHGLRPSRLIKIEIYHAALKIAAV